MPGTTTKRSDGLAIGSETGIGRATNRVPAPALPILEIVGAALLAGTAIAALWELFPWR